MSERKWTQQQRSAIDAHGGTVLVSAAAGSGKTAVLVQRVIEKLTSDDPAIACDADRLLIVTFTRAAAAEMKERIAAQLQQRLQQNPWDSRLRRQMILLKKAQISTIHSFCSALIRDHFYQLEISPDFRIADAAELKIMREECVSEVLEQFYAEADPDFIGLAEQLIGEKNDVELSELVKSLEDHVSSCPFPEDYLDWLEHAYEGENASDSIWARATMEGVRKAVEYAMLYNRMAADIASSDEKLTEKYLPSFEKDAEVLEEIHAAAVGCQWNRLYKAASTADVAPLGRGRNFPPEAEIAKAARSVVKDTMEEIRQSVISDEAQFVKEIKFTGKMVCVLIKILRQYMALLRESKQRRKVLDFGDLEHLSVRLLTEKKPGASDAADFGGTMDYNTVYRKTETALTVSAQFDEIMLDEYQDTNAVQSLIFSAVARSAEGSDPRELSDGVNLFMVGDMKQSIYRFRKAVPELFMEKFSRYTPYSAEETVYPALITLGANFRSRPEVTGTINFVFRTIMSQEMGGVDYDEAQALTARAVYPEAEGMTPEMHFLSRPNGHELSGAAYEAVYIADLIGRMMDEGFRVTDKATGELRPARYSDFCILRRSLSSNGDCYVEALEARGIPAWMSSEGGLLETDEANVMLSFLRVLGNPLLDIPLMCVMMSPIYAFSPDEMAEIRLKERSAPLYGAVMSMAKDGSAKCAAFLESMEKFRLLASTVSADRLMEEIMYATGYMAAVSAMPNGEIRLATLRLLCEFAASCERSGSFGTGALIAAVDRMLEQGEDLPGASSVTENSDVVRVMTIHKSKGLEFPVCIVAGLGSQFNKDGDVGGVMTHNDLGVGMKLKEDGVYYETQPRRAMIDRAYTESLSEEMRVLYVALTRAREKLILVATPRSLPSCINSAALAVCGGGIPPYALVRSGSFAVWLTMAVIRHPDGGALRERADLPVEALPADGSRFHIVFYEEPEEEETDRSSDEAAEKAEAVEPTDETRPAPNPELMALIEERLQYRYPYDALLGVPAKVTASELTRREHSGDTIDLVRPSFLMAGGLTPVERGKALHKYMEFANFRAAAESPDRELERLLRYGFLTENEAKAVDIEKVRRFFVQMQHMLSQAEEIWRERAFSVMLDRAHTALVTDVPLEEEAVVLEGECDCVLEYEDGSVILDYKTDRISDPQKLIEHYATQLRLYRYAMAKVLQKPVKGIYLYSFYLDKLIEVE